MTYIWTVVCFFIRLILSLRYRIEVKGLEKLTSKNFSRPGGILFLPNHPAHMDPLILMLFCWPKFRMRPLVIEYIYRQSGLRGLMKFVKALSIPNFETSVNQIKIRKAEQIIETISSGLKRGENFLLYPSGRLKVGPKEILGGASATYSLLQECPTANVVLVRITGLWGSSFSRALVGRSPDLKPTIWRGMKAAFKSLIFFLPRRSISLEIELEPSELPRQGTRAELNRYLEGWYNQYRDREGNLCEEEPAQLVSYSMWRKDIPSLFQPKKKEKQSAQAPVSSENREKIYSELRRIIENPQIDIRPEMHLALDLTMDSLQIAELIAFLGRYYDVDELHPEDLETVQSVLEVAEGKRTTEQSVYQIMHSTWPAEKNRPEAFLSDGKTIPEVFLKTCQRMNGFVACGDDLIGLLTYRQLKRAVLVLAAEFQRRPQTHIGVLLPASVGAHLVILALQLAGKVPVMLNWTLGSRYLDEMGSIAQVDLVITSWRFLERLSHVEFGSLIDRVELLEDLRENLKLKTKLRGALLSLLGPQSILRAFKAHKINEDAIAGILFTSGTEATPKAVPLSHKNILFNQSSAMQCIDIKNSDALYGILPPFHSFGFSVAGLFPLLAGVKVAFYPDPTDSFALAEGIHRWQITVFCSAPSFLKGLFQTAKDEQLRSVRYFVTGAERTPPELYDRVSQLRTNAKLIEGYGVTECSPILSINRPHSEKHGIGKPVPGVEVRTIHPETQQPLSLGKEGEICVKGFNVFKGYLGNVHSPFVEIEGALWYRTGDLGYLDKEGTLILSGRIKRFTKLGGEMISLGAIEAAISDELVRRHLISTETTSIAVCADEKIASKPQLILFSTVVLEKEKINGLLKEAGFSRLVKIAQIHTIPEIPLMGTGKTDYRSLQSMVC